MEQKLNENKSINNSSLDEIQRSIELLESKYKTKIEKNPELTRMLVSFQANKKEAGFRWFKFKEGYSSALVKYTLEKLKINPNNGIDPFAGSGTTLFVLNSLGKKATGIELLPISNEIIAVRSLLTVKENREKTSKLIKKWLEDKPWEKHNELKSINHIRITAGAFPEKNEKDLSRYLSAIQQISDKNSRRVMRFAALCILESISFTRKDGQYLRWDKRSGRTTGSKKFDKGEIKSFKQAIEEKLSTIYEDINKWPKDDLSNSDKITLLSGSCLDILPELKTESYDFLMTSPPYCNRYDYTRTYALELAILETNEEKIRNLRQQMLSCTVENRDKLELNKSFKQTYVNAASVFDKQKTLHKILNYLEYEKSQGNLNNPGIVRMIKNYFFEMCLVIFESSRILKKGSFFIMVNDNVRYAGAHIPVDLILSDFAQAAGLRIVKIWTLPNGKGNSSQQMGNYGRNELRKCLYVWQKL